MKSGACSAEICQQVAQNKVSKSVCFAFKAYGKLAAHVVGHISFLQRISRNRDENDFEANNRPCNFAAPLTTPRKLRRGSSILSRRQAERARLQSLQSSSACRTPISQALGRRDFIHSAVNSENALECRVMRYDSNFVSRHSDIKLVAVPGIDCRFESLGSVFIYLVRVKSAVRDIKALLYFAALRFAEGDMRGIIAEYV